MEIDKVYKYEMKMTKSGICLVKLLQLTWDNGKHYSEIWIPKDSIIGYISGYDGNMLITNVLFSHYSHSSNTIEVDSECWKAIVKNLFE